MTRKILSVVTAALTLCSCSTITHTSQTAGVDTQIYNLTVADLKVAEKKDSVTVDWKWNPLSEISLKAQKETATHALLKANDADVLVEPEYIVNRRGIFRGGSVTVTGYPASYSDFRPMTTNDAEKLAMVNGNLSPVVVSPFIATTAGKVVRQPRSKTISTLGFAKESRRHQFVNLFGGLTWDVNNYVDAGWQFGVMYGNYGNRWGWYGKLALNGANCNDYVEYQYDESKCTANVTFGAIKPIAGGFSVFAGLGLGGYFTSEFDYDYYSYYDRDVVKFSIPVELGFMMRVKKVNVMLGATYATPLSSGSGNLNPFLGIGYSF